MSQTGLYVIGNITCLLGFGYSNGSSFTSCYGVIFLTICVHVTVWVILCSVYSVNIVFSFCTTSVGMLKDTCFPYNSILSIACFLLFSISWFFLLSRISVFNRFFACLMKLAFSSWAFVGCFIFLWNCYLANYLKTTCTHRISFYCLFGMARFSSCSSRWIPGQIISLRLLGCVLIKVSCLHP